MTTELIQTDVVKCFKLGRYLIVPHYSKPHIYVGPGYPKFNKREYTSKELLEFGAKKTIEHLWDRPTKPTGK